MMGGSGTLVYASDHPHEHGDGLPRLLDRLGDEQRRGVLWGNAATLYDWTNG
jgi:predicted TIM-barrel fold metal-dependent hydrolase